MKPASLAIMLVAVGAAALLWSFPSLAQSAPLPTDSVVEQLLKYGLAGIVMLVEGVVIINLWRKLQEKEAELRATSVETARMLERATTQMARVNARFGAGDVP